METMTDFFFLGSKITADGNCSQEIKRCLLLGRKSMIKLDSILKKRDITLPTKVRLVKVMVFPVVLYGYESWTMKAEHWRIDAFELWCWKRLLRVPWTARIPNQSILKKISCEYSLEGLMLKLKLQYFGYLMQRTDSLEKTLMAGKDWRQAETGMTEDEMASLFWWMWIWANFGNWWCTGKPGVLQSLGSQRVTHKWATELNWSVILVHLKLFFKSLCHSFQNNFF